MRWDLAFRHDLFDGLFVGSFSYVHHDPPPPRELHSSSDFASLVAPEKQPVETHGRPSNLDELRGVGSRREAASSKLAVLSDRLIFKIKRLDVIVKRGRVGGILQDVAHLHPFSFGGRPAMNKEQNDGFQAQAAETFKGPNHAFFRGKTCCGPLRDSGCGEPMFHPATWRR